MSTGWTNYSIGNGSQAGEDDGPVSVGGENDTPACVSCKKRKLRCSREVPTCSHCVRLSAECIYQPKNKPGLKPGAVEALTRRVAFLERILLDEDGNIKSRYQDNDATTQSGSHVADDAPRHVASCTKEDMQPTHGSFQNSTEQMSRGGIEKNGVNPLKRRFELPVAESSLLAFEDVDIYQHLPPQPLLEKVADFFCISFHHWIPYIHKKRLQTRVRQGDQDAGLALVLHALCSITLRHMDPNVVFLDNDQIHQQTRVSRMIVETHALRNVTIESLQALIFLVFDLLNDGEMQRAWPLIGSLTRTIDYLQLTTEPLVAQTGSLMTPVRLVRPSNDWTELEERRRLFWIIFLLDRFCSVSTGWNTSLTADDVHRRLPADGGYFTREEPVTTPYFGMYLHHANLKSFNWVRCNLIANSQLTRTGIWNKAAARIGRSLANVPAQYNEEDPATDLPPGASPNSANGYIDASKLGAFAYCVEATESLSQVTTFFLQQRINWQDKEHAVSWLTRFKELDLRLVQWKMFLPPRWKDSNISSDRAVVDMDPNLTLAHITHNTSMILLHHPIGYPPRGWNEFVALPKECSAQTCELAAVETSNIVDKFLAHTPIPFVNVQFSFCAFVAAKALLFKHQDTRLPLRPEFQRLVCNLWEMASRWGGKSIDSNDAGKPDNQAARYANHLERLLEACQGDASFRFDFYNHSNLTLDPHHHISPTYATPPQVRSSSFAHDRPLMKMHQRHNSMHSSPSTLSPRHIPPSMTRTTTAISSSSTTYDASQAQAHIQPQPQPPNTLPSMYPPQPHPPAHMASSYPPSLYQGNAHPTPSTTSFHPPLDTRGAHTQSVQDQDQSLLSLSDAFMDSHFLDMDRVITFEDANFFLPGDALRWQ